MQVSRIEKILTQRHMKKYLAELEDIAGLMSHQPGSKADRGAADQLEEVDALRVQSIDGAPTLPSCRFNAAGDTSLQSALVSMTERASCWVSAGVEANEFMLYHGAPSDIIEQLQLSGLDPRRGGENRGKLFGVGTYLAAVG